MKFFLLLIVLVLNANFLIAQVKKAQTKPKVTAKPVVNVNQKLKDSITDLLTAGRWRMTYVIVNGKKNEVPAHVEDAQKPRIKMTKDGFFKATGAEKQDVNTTWQLSNDARYFTTKEDNRTDKFKINLLTKEKKWKLHP
jgi:hypothetical protein